MHLLHIAARHARICLVLGLVAGLTLPGVAQIIKPWLPLLVAFLLLLSSVRIGLRAALGSFADLRQTATLVTVFQLALPLLALAVIFLAGLTESQLALAIVLMLSAPSITGSVNFTALMGHDPAPPMRLLIFGTAVFPLTVLPVLWLMPGLGDASDVLLAALMLLFVIALSVGLGFALRRAVLTPPTEAQIRALDGASAIVLAVMVVGLMSALGPALRSVPGEVLFWLVAVLITNFGLQSAAYVLGQSPGASVVAGNRNVALFLVALPAEAVDPLLIFIGCYQIPMYLTPIVMDRIYRRHTPSSTC
ncbi:MAG: hypothetical protein HKN18_07375 [Silicimonas sp.]|nr:hypothetical protein [Silicimonas sp.]